MIKGRRHESDFMKNLRAEALARITDEAILERIKFAYTYFRSGASKEPAITAGWLTDCFADDDSPDRQAIRRHIQSRLLVLYRAGKLNRSIAPGRHNREVLAYDPVEEKV